MNQLLIAEREKDRLEYELETERHRARRSEEAAREERRQREREYIAEMDRAYRVAADWPDALKKQAVLMEREQYLDVYNSPDPADTYFTDGAAACRRALELWHETDAKVTERRAELQRQMDALDEEVRNDVAERLLAEKDRQGWNQIAYAIRNGVDATAWLNW